MQTPRDSEGRGSLVCCSPWDCRVRHNLVTEQQQQNEIQGKTSGRLKFLSHL